MISRSFLCLFATLLIHSSRGWSPTPLFGAKTTPLFGAKKAHHTNIDLSSPRQDGAEEDACESRRMFLSAAAMQICLLGAATSPANAAEATTVYKSGKTPIVPGQKPKDKNDTKGTKKDPDFLRSIADCRSQCQSSIGPDGFAKSKEDCLSECQDICCTTYEQW
jgi:hypothetical protein